MEDQYLSFVLRKLREKIAQLGISLAQGEQEVEAMNDYYWENYTEMDEYGYENYDNQKALFTQIRANNEALDLKRRYVRMLDSPYFGRVDFRYNDEDGIPEEEAETYYIGLGNFSERPGALPLVYDWRAPVSSLFYDFDRGEASFEAPGGLMTGEITSKWQYKIKKGRMIYAFESDVKIDDEVLKRELGANGDVKLKNIVATIQKEQNAIIRNTKDRILVVQGCAGSGKTSVALHRISYLLYHDRKNLTSKSVLVLSPSGIFTDYISHILPELGEGNIREMSFDLFAYRELKCVAADCEDRFDEIERQIAGKKSRAAIKQTKEFAEKLRGFVLRLENDLMDFKDFSYKKMFVPARDLEILFYEKFPQVPLLDRMKVIMEYVVDDEEAVRGKDFSDEEKQLIEDLMMKMYETRDLYLLYSQFLKENGMKPLPNKVYEERKIPYEDVYPMLYLKYLLQAPGKHRRIRHLVIDEMQDYSYMQFLLISQLFQCPMTILGDKAQTMDEAEHDVTRFLPSLLSKDVRVISMNRSYRSTMEIMAEAARFKETDDTIPFERHGKIPEIIEINGVSAKESYARAAGQIRKRLSLRREDPDHGEYETAAVLCYSMKEAEAVCRELKEAARAQEVPEPVLLTRDSDHFPEGLVVTTFYLAKGLEFDQVFMLYDPADDRPITRQARYICTTRALHELYRMEIHKKEGKK